jgi:dienelactone hydrolase
MMKQLLVTLAVAAFGLGQAGRAGAEPVASLADGRTGKIEFASATPPGFYPLVHRMSSPQAAISGVLTLPAGDARVPAMVLAHGSGGVSSGREGRWSSRLTEIGIGAFVVDSFGPRGIKETATNQGQLSPAANVADAFAALKLLATHPRVDPTRIGIMGFSRGGQVAIYTALEQMRRGIIDGDLRFAVHVPFYPPCNTLFVSDRITGAPIRFMLGGADDYTPASACPRYVDWFRSMGAAADSILYEDAHHAFDGTARVQFINNLQTGRNCDARYHVERGELQRLDTGDVLRGNEPIAAYFRSCSSRGATIGGNYQAAQKAAADLAAYLKQVFKL